MNITKLSGISATRTQRVPIHLWIYNHPFVGISDQVEFFLSIMLQHGYVVSVGRKPLSNGLNIVIENFSDPTARTLINFCQASSKRVAVIMTEHLDFVDHEIYIHGTPMQNENDYMHPATQAARIKCLMDCACYIRGFLVLGDLPELVNFGDMMPGLAIRTLPFPDLAGRPRFMVRFAGRFGFYWKGDRLSGGVAAPTPEHANSAVSQRIPIP